MPQMNLVVSRLPFPLMFLQKILTRNMILTGAHNPDSDLRYDPAQPKTVLPFLEFSLALGCNLVYKSITTSILTRRAKVLNH